MLYRTHRRYGMLSGLLAIPLAVSLSLIPTVVKSHELFIILVCIYMALRGAIFGSEFPDCDSYGGVIKDNYGNPMHDSMGNVMMKKGSVPSQKHPLISKIFRACGVKHRGKFSHDYASETFFWGAILLVFNVISKFVISQISGGNTFINIIMNISIFILAWLISIDLIDFFSSLTGMFNGSFKKSFHDYTWDIDPVRLRKAFLLFIVVVVFMIISGAATLNLGSTDSALRNASIMLNGGKLYILFTLFGVYSHLIADSMTIEGTSIFFIPFKPMVIFDKMLPGKNFRTGSIYENGVRLVVTILLVPALWFAMTALF